MSETKVPTLFNLKEFTVEEIVVFVRDKLKAQGGKSFMVNDRGATVCRYRDPNGNCCAVGLLIPEDKYSASLEEQGYSGVLDDLLGIGEDYEQLVLPQHLILGKLQTIHDCLSVYDWDEAFEELLRRVKADCWQDWNPRRPLTAAPE